MSQGAAYVVNSTGHRLGVGDSCSLVRELGSGSQGSVLLLESNGQQFAFKAFYEHVLKSDPGIWGRITELVEAGCPHESFLWPLDLIVIKTDTGEESGYVMPVREKDYVSATELMTGSLSIDFRNLLKACLELTEAFYCLHMKGMCYKDISFGNFFLNAESGKCLICDIDNVCYDDGSTGGVLGTPYFMAPEVVEGISKPSAATDMHSLSVLIFYLLFIGHPLEGQAESRIRIMDEAARRHLFGEKAVYIFDPTNGENRPDPEIHGNVLMMEKILPKSLKRTFEKAFTTGLHNPHMRVVEAEWKISITEALNQLGHCSHCGQEVFMTTSDNKQRIECWDCNMASFPIVIKTNKGEIIATPGVDLLDQDEAHLGTVIRHPVRNELLGLMNKSSFPWQSVKLDGTKAEVIPGKSAVLGNGVRIETRTGSIEITQQEAP